MTVFFSEFMGNDSERGTNKLLDLFVPRSDPFPMNPEKKDSFLKCIFQRRIHYRKTKGIASIKSLVLGKLTVQVTGYCISI